MTARIAAITFDARDAAALAAFWAEVVGRPVDPGPNRFFATIGRHDAAPWLMFLAVQEGKTAKNRCHVDLDTADREAEVARLVGLGAQRVADHDEYGLRWTTLRDPDGNEFCVASHRPAEAPDPDR